MPFAPTSPGTVLTANTTPVKTAIWGDTFVIQNTGTNPIYVLGLDSNSTATADATCTPVAAGDLVNFDAAGSVAISVYSTAANIFKLLLGGGEYSGKFASAAGGGGGGGASTIADGADVAEGSTNDAAATPGGAGTLSSKQRLMTSQLDTGNTRLATIAANTTNAATTTLQTSGNASLVTIAANTSGIATSAKQDTGNNSLATVVTNTTNGLTTTTPGTTNKVAIINGQDGVDGGAGTTSAKTQRVVLASDSPALAVAAPTDSSATGTISVLNSNPNSGTATANSFVQIPLQGDASVAVHFLSNTWTSGLFAQVSINGNDWLMVTATFLPAGPTWGSTGVLGAGFVGTVQFNVAGYKFFRISSNGAGSGSAVVYVTGSIATSVIPTYTNLTHIGGAGAAMAGANGSANTALTVGIAGTSQATDYAAQAWAATSGSGAIVTDSSATGGVISCDVNLSAFTAGASTGLDIFLQHTPDSGTTFYDVWQCEALTAAGHVLIPAVLMIGGRRRMRWVNRGGAATTATVTVTTNRMSFVPNALVRQWFDRTAALINGTAGGTTTGYINNALGNVAGAGYDVSGCKVISASVTLGAVTTTAATYQLQTCSFNSTSNSDWSSVGSAVVAVANATTDITFTNNTKRFARLFVTSAGSGQTGVVVAITGSN